jgi:hypothetical protein
MSKKRIVKPPPSQPIAGSQSQASDAFEHDVQSSLTRLQEVLNAAVESLEEYPRKSTDLARLLGLERNVAWKLFRLIHERDVFVAARFVPGAASMATFVTGAAAAGVPEALLTRVAEATERYESVVRRHAGDRASADIMLGGKSGEAAELALRRSAYRSMSFLAGVQAEAQLQTFIMAPSADGKMVDGVSVNGFVGLTRVRPGAPVVIGRAMRTDDRGAVLSSGKEEPIEEPRDETEVVSLLHEFCSMPLPKFRRQPGERGFVENELEEGPVGRTGAITFMAGTIVRGVGNRYRSADQTTMDVVARVRTPSALLVCDVLVKRGLVLPESQRAGVYGDLFGLALLRWAGRERYRLASVHRVEHLGTGPASAHTPDIPRYTRMLEYVFGRIGWNGEEFDVYRTRIEFPFSPTSVMVSFDLAE